MTRGIRFTLLLAVIAVLSAAAGVAWHFATEREAQARALAERIYAATLPDPHGALQPFARWRGTVLVVNFWATWCAPCREEMPGFVRLQSRLGGAGLQFVGVAIDQPAAADRFARALGVNYPVVVSSGEALEWMRLGGNAKGVLPYTLVLDRSGKVVFRHLGVVQEAALQALVEPLLAEKPRK